MLDFASAWEKVADVVPEREAIVFGERRISYHQFDDAAARFAGALVSAGVREGAKVALYLYNCPEYLIAQHGAFKHRAVPVNVNYRYLDEELVYLIENSDAEVLVFHSSLSKCVERVRDKLRAIRLFVEVDDDGRHLDGTWRFDDLLEAREPQPRKSRRVEDLYMLYTGGTTGMPKGVMFRQGEFIESLFLGAVVLGVLRTVPTDAKSLGRLLGEVSEENRVVSVTCCPLMHGTGMWIGAMGALMTGGTVVLLGSRSFDADEVWRLIERERVTRIVIVGDPFARPLLRALEERESSGQPYPPTPCANRLGRGHLERRDQGPTAFAHVGDADRRPGLDRGRHLRAQQASQPRGRCGDGALHARPRHQGRHRGRAHCHARVPATRASWRVVPPPRVLQGPREDGADIHHPRRQRSTSLTGDWATVDARGDHVARSRFNCGELRRREGVRRRSRRGDQRHPLVDDCLVVGLPDERFGQRLVAVISSSYPPALRATDRPIFSCEHTRSLQDPERGRDRVIGPRAPNGKADYGWALRTALATSD